MTKESTPNPPSILETRSSFPEPAAESYRAVRCTAIRADGSPCRAWSVRGSDPPRCAPHGGGQRPVGAPRGNQNARSHGFYADTGILSSAAGDDDVDLGSTIELVIADLSVKQALLSQYIDRLREDPNADSRDLCRLLSIHGANASRLGRLLRDQQVLRGDGHDLLQQAINTALDELSAELGVEL